MPPPGEPVKQVKAVVFIRPTQENIQLLSNELKKPRFGKYYLYFSNTISKSDVKVLAESDEQESVCDIQEFFADFYALDRRHFTLNLPPCAYQFTWTQQQLARCCQGVAAAALALKKRPVIRYAGVSDMCKRLAESIGHMVAREAGLFDFRDSASTLLLIVDRRQDPVTPLLNQWTYEAMTHELVGISNGRVSFDSRANVDKSLSEIVLSPLQDQFYQQNLSKNFGEIGVAIKKLMEEFQAKTKSQQKVESIQDMKNFVENYPQFKKMSGAVSKHVTLVSELSRIVAAGNLMEISELEQDITCGSDHADILQRLRAMMKNQKTSSYEALRLVALYTLRYGGRASNSSSSLIQTANHRNGRRVVDALTRYSLQQFSKEEERDIAKAFSITKRFFKDLQGVENVYTQHKPALVKSLLEQCVQGRLREGDYPTVGIHTVQKPSEVIVFVVGGSTYEEIAYVESFNQSTPGVNVVLGGTCVHNSRSFIDEVMNACGGRD